MEPTLSKEAKLLAILVLADSNEAIDIEKFFLSPPVSVSPHEGSDEESVLVNLDGQLTQDQLRTFTGKLLLGLDGYV